MLDEEIETEINIIKTVDHGGGSALKNRDCSLNCPQHN